MIRGIIEIANQLSPQQATVVAALIGLLSALIVAVLGLFGSAFMFYLNKNNERKTELRKIKEQQFLDFLGSLAALKTAGPGEKNEVQSVLSKRVQTIFLVGNNKVQTALKAFLDYFLGEKQDIDQQNRLYANLIREMRKDLYGKRIESLDSILLTTFRD